MATVLLHPDVDATLTDFPADVEERIRSKLADAGENPDRFLSRLTGRDDWKLRIGDYRAIIDWDKQRDELRVTDLDKRDRIYD